MSNITNFFITLFVFLSVTSGQSAGLIHSQYLPYAAGGGDAHYGMSYDSGATSQFIYVALHNMPVFPNEPTYVLRSYELNSSTGQYTITTPFVAAGPGALYTDAKYIKIGLAKPGATILQHFYYLTDSLLGDKIGWATVNSSTGKISQIAGTLTQGTGGVEGLNNATEIAITPSLTQSYLYTAGEAEDVVGIFSRNMTTGALSYVGRHGPEMSPALVNPKDLAINPSGSRLAVVSDNRLSIFTINSNGTLSIAHDLTAGECFSDIRDVVLTDNNNILYLSTTGGVRRVVRSSVTFTWSCSNFSPPFWTGATVRIGPGRVDGQIIASVYAEDLDSVAALDMTTASTVVLSDIYNTPSENYFLRPIAAVMTKDAQRVLVGNKGILVNFELVDGLNVFRFDDSLFSNGFE